MGRVKAALIHFGISLVVFCSIVAVAILAWYPPPYFFADGGWQMIRMAAGVDVVLGPLLTLVVFKSGKPRLKIDLGIITILQVSVLIWGVVLMYQQRPVFVAFGVNQFYTVTEGELAHDDQLATKLKMLERGTPVMVFVKLPDDPNKRLALLMAALGGGDIFYALPHLYEPLSENIPEVLKAGLNIADLANKNPEDQAKLDAFLKRQGGQAEDYAFVPLTCKYKSLIMALHKPDGKVAGTLDIAPPQS